MSLYKKFDNGLRLVANKIDGMLSVTAGILVKTGSVNESENENGISHFIEHCVFKGTKKRSAYEISDYTDRIGAQINAFTSKETTCFYTKSTADHLTECLDVLSDIFFDATFEKEEIDKEKGVIIEEINMSEDSPEDLLLDLLAESYYGAEGFGRTILGSAKNVRSFEKQAVEKYMDEYYTADNVVISIAGNIDENECVSLAEKYFADRFKRLKSKSQYKTVKTYNGNVFKTKRIEQAHIGLAMKGVSVSDERIDALGIANAIFGGGMSSRLFQKIREEMGLAYTVYSYSSQYKDNGVLEIYAGVNTESRDKALDAIVKEIKNFKENKITEAEFLRGREQIKSSFVLGRESTASQMLLAGKYLLFLGEHFDFKKRLEKFEKVTFKTVLDVIDDLFSVDKVAVATLGRSTKGLTL